MRTSLPVVMLITAALALTTSPATCAESRMAALRARLASTQDGCEIADVRLSASEVPCFEKLEVTFELTASYTNPYDPDDIRVEAAITLPDGATVTAPAFYSEQCEPTRGVAQMMLWVPYEQAGDAPRRRGRGLSVAQAPSPANAVW